MMYLHIAALSAFLLIFLPRTVAEQPHQLPGYNPYGTCFSKLAASDTSKDGLLKKREYAGALLQLTGGALNLTSWNDVPEALREPFRSRKTETVKGIDIKYLDNPETMNSAQKQALSLLCEEIYTGLLEALSVTVSEQQCKMALLLGDMDGDKLLKKDGSRSDSIEFTRFVNQFSGNDAFGMNTAFSDLPPPIKDTFEDFSVTLADGSTAVNITKFYDQKDLLDQLCKHTTIAIVAGEAATADPPTHSTPTTTSNSPASAPRPEPPTTASGLAHLDSPEFLWCKMQMEFSDSSRDEKFSQADFSTFLYRLGYNSEGIGSTPTFDSLPADLQEVFTEFADPDTQAIDISAYKSDSETIAPEQTSHLQQFCHETMALFVPNYDLITCKRFLSLSDDKETDNMLSSTEYSAFLSLMSNGQLVVDEPYGAFVGVVRDTFISVALSGKISIDGTKIGQNPTAEQNDYLKQVCSATHDLVEFILTSRKSGQDGSPPFTDCLTDMATADANSDTALDYIEYTAFVGAFGSELSKNYTAFSELPESLQRNWQSITRNNTEEDGVTPIINLVSNYATMEELIQLRNVCHTTWTAIQAGEDIIQTKTPTPITKSPTPIAPYHYTTVTPTSEPPGNNENNTSDTPGNNQNTTLTVPTKEPTDPGNNKMTMIIVAACGAVVLLLILLFSAHRFFLRPRGIFSKRFKNNANMNIIADNNNSMDTHDSGVFIPPAEATNTSPGSFAVSEGGFSKAWPAFGFGSGGGGGGGGGSKGGKESLSDAEKASIQRNDSDTDSFSVDDVENQSKSSNIHVPFFDKPSIAPTGAPLFPRTHGEGFGIFHSDDEDEEDDDGENGGNANPLREAESVVKEWPKAQQPIFPSGDFGFQDEDSEIYTNDEAENGKFVAGINSGDETWSASGIYTEEEVDDEGDGSDESSEDSDDEHHDRFSESEEEEEEEEEEYNASDSEYGSDEDSEEFFDEHSEDGSQEGSVQLVEEISYVEPEEDSRDESYEEDHGDEEYSEEYEEDSVEDESDSGNSVDYEMEKYRDEVEALVQKVAPDEVHTVDAMMYKFSGRIPELIATLQKMHDRSKTQSSPESVQRSNSQSSNSSKFRSEAAKKLLKKLQNASVWYVRLGRPSRDRFRSIIDEATDVTMTERDVDLLPWDAEGRTVDWQQLQKMLKEGSR